MVARDEFLKRLEKELSSEEVSLTEIMLAGVRVLEPELRKEGTSYTSKWVSTPGGGFREGMELKWNPKTQLWEGSKGHTFPTVESYLRTWWRPYNRARDIIETLVKDLHVESPVETIFGRG